MDRIDAMRVFIAAVDEGSLAGAARKLKRSATATSRALNALEEHVGVELLHRTTRTLKLSEAGQRYVLACRRVLVDLEEADMVAGGERSSPKGMLTISAPPILGEEVLRPILDEFLTVHPSVSVRMLMHDRSVNLVDEGVDITLRIGAPADSSNIATREEAAADLATARAIGVTSFPALFLRKESRLQLVSPGYAKVDELEARLKAAA